MFEILCPLPAVFWWKTVQIANAVYVADGEQISGFIMNLIEFPAAATGLDHVPDEYGYSGSR